MKIQQVVILILLLPDFVSQESVVITPPVTAGKLGGTVHFSCEVEFGQQKTMSWEFNGKIIYSILGDTEDYPQKDKEKYSVERGENNFTLTVNDLLFEDGGVYTCIAFIERTTAVLMVLGEPALTPSTQSLTEGDTAVFTCEAYFAGPIKESIVQNHYPEMKIYLENYQSKGKYNEMGSINGRQDYQLRRVFDIKVESSMHEKQLICEVRVPSSAVNVTAVSIFNVQYPVHNTNYSPKKDTYEIGSQITCSADGNPSPSVEWVNLVQAEQSVKGTQLNISKEMIGKNTWECSSSNFVKGKVHTDSVKAEFEAVLDTQAQSVTNENGGAGVSTIGIVSVFVPLLGICIGVIFAVLKYKHTKQTVTDKDATEEEPMNPVGVSHAKRTEIFVDKLKDKLEANEDLTDMLLATSTQSLCKEKPSVLVKIIVETKVLIEYTRYVKIVEEIVKLYAEYANHLQEDPLLCLVEQLERGPATSLVKYSKRLYPVIKLLLHLGGKHDTRGRCMKMLMKNTKEGKLCRGLSTPEGEYNLTWDEDFISVLKRLANLHVAAKYLHLLAEITPHILPCEPQILENLMQLFDKMIISDNNNYNEELRTPLLFFADSMSKLPTFFSDVRTSYYTDIITQLKTVIGHLKNMKPVECSVNDEVTALNRFILGITKNCHNKLSELTLEFTKEIANELKTETTVNIPYNDGSTLLHVLIEELTPSGIIETNQQQEVLNLLYCLKSSSNIHHLNRNRQTALHCWVQRADEWADNPELFKQIVQVLVSQENVTMQDENENMPEQLFVSKASWHQMNPNIFNEVKLLLRNDFME